MVWLVVGWLETEIDWHEARLETDWTFAATAWAVADLKRVRNEKTDGTVLIELTDQIDRIGLGSEIAG